jgi:hypothetical protein
MSWIAGLIKLAPIIGGLAGTIMDKLWPDRSEAKARAHEIEMEEMRKFRLPPKTLLRYVIIGFFVFVVLWSAVAAFVPTLPGPPAIAVQLLGLGDDLFGLGGQ